MAKAELKYRSAVQSVEKVTRDGDFVDRLRRRTPGGAVRIYSMSASAQLPIPETA
ncbi:MAG: hypothetical protein SO125_05580 [Eubacteriales bacterium]|nr:hypothetical protein [Eubacteriales bacterium]